MEGAKVTKIIFLISLAACGSHGRRYRGFEGSISALAGGGKHLSSLSDSMDIVMNKVGGLVDDEKSSDFEKGVKYLLKNVNDISLDMLSEHDGKPPFRIEQHVLEALNPLGPLACIAGKSPKEPATAMFMMGGIAGSMMGELLGRRASTADYDLREVFADIGGLAGVMGSAAGAVVPADGKTFDMDTFNWLLPDADTVLEMWQRVGKDKTDLLLKEMQDLVEGADGNIDNIVMDVNVLASKLRKTLAKKSLGSAQGDQTRVVGVSSKIQSKARADISSTAMVAGMLTTLTRSRPKTPAAMKKSIESALAATRRFGQLLKKVRSRIRGKGRKLSLFSVKELEKLAINMGKVMGYTGQRAKRIFENQNIMSAQGSAMFGFGGFKFPHYDQKFIKRKSQMLFGRQKGRLSYQKQLRKARTGKRSEDCMACLAPTMEELERQKKMMMPKLEILDWETPFYTSAKDSVSQKGLPKFLVGDMLSSDWGVTDEQILLPQGLAPSDFDESFIPNLMEMPEILDFIAYANRDGKTTLINFLKGNVETADLPTGSLQLLPKKVLEYMPKKDEISDENILEALREGNVDIYSIAEFMKNISDERLIKFLEVASSRFWEEESFVPSPKMAMMMERELSGRLENSEFSKLFNSLTPQTKIRFTCIFGFQAYILDNLADNFQDLIPDIDQCIEVTLEHYMVDEESSMRLDDELMNLYSNGITVEELKELRSLINFVPDNIFYEMDKDEAMKIAEANVSLNIRSFLPQFEPLVDALAFAATSMYENVNDTSLVNSLNMIACGLRGSLGTEYPVLSDSAMQTVKTTCRSALRKAKEDSSERMRRCMKKGRCMGLKMGSQGPRGPPIAKGPPDEYMDDQSDKSPDDQPDQNMGDQSEMKLMKPDDEDFLNNTRTPDELLELLEDRKENIWLRPDAKRKIVRRLLNGNLLPSVDSWEKIGDAATELPADLLSNTTLMDLKEFITRNSFIIEQMPGFSKKTIVSKFGSDARDLLTDMGRLKSLTREIPNSLLENLDFSQNKTLLEILSSVHWRKHQASRVLSSKRLLTLHDIRQMGKLTVGLTCHDIKAIKLSMILRIAQEIDAHIGRDMPADLAECIATKVYLYLRSKHKNDKKKMQTDLAKKVPPVIAVFFPMMHLEFIPNCRRFFMEVQHQVDRLFPTIPAILIMRDLANKAFDCYALKPPGNDSSKYGPMGPMDKEGSGGQHSSPPPPNADQRPGSPPPNLGHSKPSPPSSIGGQNNMTTTLPDTTMPSMRSVEGDDAPIDPSMANHSYTGLPEDYERESDMYNKDQMGRFPGEGFRMMGSLMCRLDGKGFNHASKEQFEMILRTMKHCVEKISKKTIGQIHKKIDEEFGKPSTWDETVLEILGPFVATLTKSQLEGIDADLFVANYELIRPPPMRGMVLDEDKTSKRLDVMDLFMMPSDASEYYGEGPTVIDREFVAFKHEDFYFAAVKLMLSDSPTAKDIQRLGPDALPSLDLSVFSASEVVDALRVLGMTNRPLPATQVDLLKDKIKEFMTANGTSVLSDELLQRLCKLASIYTASEIQSMFQVSTLETLAALGRANWSTITQVNNIMSIYLGSRQFASLTGLEIVAMRNMHCSLDTMKMDEIAADSFKFALQDIGKLRCLTQARIDTYKAKIEGAYGSIDAATLQEMGVLAAGFSADELADFGKAGSDGMVSPMDKDVNIIPAAALKVIPSTRIISGFDESQYARLGTVNGAIIMQRRDIFSNVANSTKNAIFAATFGLNAGIYAGYVHHYRTFDTEAMAELDRQIQEMMESMDGMGKPGGSQSGKPNRKKPVRIQISMTYGLRDLSEARRPSPPPLMGGLSVEDIMGNFDRKFLQDRIIVQMINSASSSNMQVIQVLTGESSINDIPDSDFGSVPPKLLQGMSRDTVQEMTPEKLALLLDSDLVSQDPWSLSKLLKKLTLDQFKTALTQMSQKMENKTDGIWRPPITIQKTVATRFFQFDHGSEEEALKAFLSCMCPFSAGVSPRQFMDLPQDASFIEPLIKCLDLSYKDLEMRHKRQLLNWVGTMWEEDTINADRAITLRNFLLDFPLHWLQEIFTISDVITYVNSGNLLILDTTHRKFLQLAKFIIKTTLNYDETKFNEETYMENLGRAKCEIRVKNVKKILSSEALKSLLDYNMKHCKDQETELKESMAECTGDALLRLKRCGIMIQEMKKTSSMSVSSSFIKMNRPVKAEMQRASLRDFEMMKDVVDVYLKDADFSQLGSDNVREVAGAFGALKPNDIEAIPEEAILDNMDVLKTNTKLTKKQKRQIFQKIQSAGFELTDASSVSDLGELVTSVPPTEFKKLSVAGLKESLSELKKHADSLSPAQKKAIVSKLNEGSVEDLLDADLGDMVTEIPLSDLDSLETIDMEKLKDKPWTRGQAASLVEKFREDANGSLTVPDLRDMGQASLGVTCKDVMNILDDEAYDAAQALVDETEGKLPLDMDECALNKLHYALKVLEGEDYLSNASNPELASTLQYIPDDVAMMMPADDLDNVPSDACMNIMENIGNANLEKLPLGVGDVKRKRLANTSLNCIKENRLVEAPLDEREAIMLGQLVCDLPTEEWEEFSTEAFTEVLPVLRDCFHRLSTAQIGHIKTFVIETYGSNSSDWGEDVLTNLGPLVTILDKETIDDIDNDLFFESMDATMPPEYPEDTDAATAVDYDGYYDKAAGAVMAQKEEDEEERRRRKREVSIPTYDEIILLGPGNVAWTVEELNAIAEDDFTNSLETFGAINGWSYDQRAALVERLKTTYGALKTWDEKVIRDAKHLMNGLPSHELSELEIEDIETCSILGEVRYNNDERNLLVQAYLKTTGKEMRTLTRSDLVGVGALACGILSSDLVELPVEEVNAVVKDLGQLECWTQKQLDILKQVRLIGKETTVPTAPELSEMGTIAAGMTSGDMTALPVESIAFIKPEAILAMTPSRIKEGFSTSQLYAAGPSNIAALMTPRIFDEILPEQRNALRMAVLGEEAELEDIPEDGEEEEIVDNAPEGLPEGFDIQSEDDHEEDPDHDAPTTDPKTTTASTATPMPQYLLLFLLFAVVFLHIK